MLALALAGCGKARVPDGSYVALAPTTSLPAASSTTTVVGATTTKLGTECLALLQKYHAVVLALSQSNAAADNALEENLKVVLLAMTRINCPTPQNGPITG